MIDLSFLTEEEQEIILAVLRRDAELKKAEEQRIQNLQKSLSDKGQLRYLTGEWFYETKQLRHQDRIHGSDIIRASMKHTNKPLTILELSQILPERSSFVSSDNKEVFVPPVLRGLLQEPHSQLSTEQYQNQDPYETQDTPTTVLQSSTKRKNPFNSEFYASHNFEEKVSQQDGATDETQKPTKRVWELLIPAVPNLVPEQESGKPAHLETRPEEDYHSRVTDGQTSHSIHQQKLPEESTIVEAPSDTQSSTSSSTKSSSYAVSPQPKQRMFGIFKREKLKSGEVQGLQRDGANMQHNKPGNTQNLSQDAADMSLDKHEDKPFQKVEVKTLQLAALQNTTFTESVTTVDVDTERDETKGRVFQSLERLSSLKSFWKREITGPKIIYPREESKQEDLSEKAIEISHLSTQNEMTVDETAGISPQTGHSFSVDSSREDGTYRANPVLIYEETDESLTGSVTEVQISESQEIIITPVMKQQESVKVPISRQSSLSPQDDRTAKIGDLKHFSETEYTEPRIVSASVKESSSNLALCNKVVSPQSDLKRLREKSEEKAQTSPSETKSSVVSKSLKVTDKGFVSLSPDWTQLKSSHGTEDTPTCHSQQFKDDTKSQERPLIPSKPPKPGSKDQDEEVRRSPSKTCHPRVLPRESFSPKRSSLEGSPLKTFPIDIDWQIKAVEEQKLKPTPLPRQRKNISHAATPTVSTDTESSSDITTCPLSSHHEDREANFDYVHCPQSNSCPPTFTAQLNKASEKKLGTFTHLARSVITQDFQHYLGPQEKAYIAPFDQEKGVAAETDVTNRTQSAPRDFAANHSDSPTKGNPRIRTVQTKAGNSSQDTTTGAWLLSRASSGSYEENSCPIMSPVEGSSSQTMSSSKSLENLTSQTTSTPPNLQQVKSSVSVPVLQQDEMDSDSTFETNLGWRRNTGSSTSNLSLSSGMASMSSVSGSISSIYPTDSGDIEVQGNIQLAVNYIQKLGEFHIFVVHCRDLAVADMKKNRSDPYVKCYLVPDKTKLGKKKTTIKKKTLNPTYNEILRFKITMEALKCQNMRVSVWHSNTFGRNSFLGEVDLDLTEWDFSNTHINEYALKARVPTQPSLSSPLCPVDSRGEMRVALRFLPQTSHSKRTSRMETGEVQIWVKDCKNLPSVRGVTIDPFVKCTVLPDSSKKSRQKTRVVKRTANPMFNHTMVYDGFRSEDLREACVEITVWDHDRLNSHYIGGLRLGLGTGKSYGVGVVWMDSTTAEANLWQRMLRSDGEWVEDVLPLRMFSVAKNTT